jgi:hypothetical protein
MKPNQTSSRPKEHHWWPVVQSRHWTDSNGHVSVTRSDGTVFPTNPLKIGRESELYTRFGTDDFKDTGIEKWFSETIDGPAAEMITYLLDPKNVYRTLFSADPKKAKTARLLGFRVNAYIDKIRLTAEIRTAIARYVAALLVRHPTYLAKLMQFHAVDAASPVDAKNRALDNMLHLFGVYAERIAKSALLISRRVGDAEYLYADGGLMVQEPWRTSHGIPFDIHAPLTPDIAIQVLPTPFATNLDVAMIAESTKQGVARQNRIILGGARRFVFSRQAPPTTFIRKYFGKPAPKNIGLSITDDGLQTSYDPSRQ